MSRRTGKNVGIIGLGTIGKRVAESVRRGGFQVFVWNRTPRPFPNFVGSPSEIAELCDFIQIFVSDDEALLEMVQQMKASLKSHHVVMAHSTVAPHTMRAAAEIVQRRNAQLLDAPFTGSKDAAGKGELVYYIGGDAEAFRRARPILEASSKEIIEIGEIGQATTIKIATNMITAATVQVASEALALVHSAGVRLDKFAAAMRSNGSNSGTLTMKLPKMLEGNFEPHFSVKHMLKDAQIASRLARASGLSIPATEAARDSLLEESRKGRDESDYSSIVHRFFPDGPPTKSVESTSTAEEQATLSGLDRSEAAKAEPIETQGETSPSTAKTAAVKADEVVKAEPSPEVERAEEIESISENELGEEEAAIAAKAIEAPAEKSADASRGFLGRLFGKSGDY